MEERILIFASSGRDAHLVSDVLKQAGIESVVCANPVMLQQELDRGAGGVLTVQEALAGEGFGVLRRYAAAQPTWSDLPILAMTTAGPDSSAILGSVGVLGNLILLERPVSKASLLSAVRSALRARQRQFLARESEKRKDEFIASLSHELRNPLAPIRTAGLLMRSLPPGSPELIKIGDTVVRQAEHLTRLVDDLLDISRITNGNTALQREKVLLSRIVAHVVELCTPLMERGGHRLEIVQPEHEVTLDADPIRLVQSIGNVLGNASKFTVKPGTIRLHIHVAGSEVVFTVEDDGIGMESAALSRIFDLFVQEESPHRGMLGGLGIGLNLTKRFAEMHGGSVRASSAGVGHGSKFTLTFPIVVADTAPLARPPGDVQSAAAHPGRVMIVDDNRDAAEMLRMILEVSGYAVTAVNDGYMAIERVAEEPPEVILMDIGLPGIDGYEVATRVRKMPGCANVKIIALSGWGDAAAKRKSAEAGMFEHFIKPVDTQMLLRCLSRIGMTVETPGT